MLFYITLGEKFYLAPIGPNMYNILDFATGNKYFKRSSNLMLSMLILSKGQEFGQLKLVIQQV